MVARFVGVSLGLLAFTVTIIAGLLVQNPVTVTLSRGILALFLFCLIGLVLGAVAQIVVDEHVETRESEILKRYRDEPTEPDQAGSEINSTEQDAAPINAQEGT